MATPAWCRHHTHLVTLPLQAAKRAVLSGTACLSRPYEVITQLQALLPAARLKAEDLADRYCTGDRCGHTAAQCMIC